MSDVWLLLVLMSITNVSEIEELITNSDYK